MGDIDQHISQIKDALDCNPPGAWMPSEALVRAFIAEIERLRNELEQAREERDAMCEAYDQERRMREFADAQCLAARALALEEAAGVGYRECAMTHHVKLGDTVAAAIRSLKGKADDR